MIDTKALREKILDLAMRGKLVPQDPNDEPASELLKRIKAEKEELIKQKKIKRDKNETEIFRGDDGLHYEKFADGTIKEIEVPYELPDGWEWANIGSISLISSFESVKSESIPIGAWIVELKDIQKETGILLKKTRKLSDSDFKSNKYHFDSGTVLYGKLRPYLQKIIISDEEGYSTTEIFPIKTTSEYSANFLYYVLFSKRVIDTINASTYGVNLPRVNPIFFKSVLLPVPPLSEQLRLITAIEKYFGLFLTIDNAQNSLKCLATQLKQKVLDVAMQGKLVPQDPNDEPASVLLEKIRAEKQRLYEEGKIKKKDLVETEIVKDGDNAYYQNLPKSWVSTTIGAIISKNIGGGTPSKQNPNYWNGNIPWASVKDINSNYLDSTKDSITQDGLANSSANLIPTGTAIIATRMSLDKIVINTIPVAINQDLRALFFENKTLRDYFVNIYPRFKFKSTGTTVKGISLPVLNSHNFPLPGTDEQTRINTKLTQVTGVINNLTT